MLSTTRFLPLAITRSGLDHACVGAISDAGRWVRPQPIALTQVSGPHASFAYEVWHEAALVPAQAHDRRPEDHDLVSANIQQHDTLSRDARLALLRRVCDADVSAAISGERSLGLVRARVQQVCVRRATGGRRFLRMAFEDQARESYDWIVPELRFADAAAPHFHGDDLDSAWAGRLVDVLCSVETYLTVGLTKPNHRFPGKFRGCHPLVVGVHSEPDYRAVLERGAR